MSGGGAKRTGSAEAGFTLVALMASIAVMTVLMGVGVRSWRQVVQDDREEELIFRGGQIADAIERYQAKNGNAPPPNLDVLVKGRFLRKLYKDPMTRKGEWRLIRQGEPLAPVPGPSPSGRPSPGASPAPFPGPAVPAGQGIGPIVGVASRSTEKGLRIFNGRRAYSEWIFAVGQPRVVGRTSVIPPLPGGGVAGQARPPQGAPVPQGPSSPR